MQVNDLTTKAMLVSLSISQWNINRQDKTATATLQFNFNSETGWARGNKSIADKKDLAKITSLINQARDFHKTNTLPWLDADNQRILPSKNYLFYTTEMRKFSDAISAEVQTLDLDSIKQKAVTALGTLYNEADYPEDLNNLRSRYSVKTNVCPIPSSTDFRISQITDEDIQKLQVEIETRVFESHKAAMRDLWNRLYEVVETAYTTFKDPEAGFHSSKLDNIQDVVDVLRRLNMDDDGKLERLCTMAEVKLVALDPKEIKNDKQTRDEATKSAEKLLELMKDYI